MSGELKKLKIEAFKDAKFSDPAQAPNSYSLQINPETYKHNHSNNFQTEAATDTAGASTKFMIMDPQTLSFEFYLDATGVLPGVSRLADEITKFKTVVYNYNGEIHSPNYLLLTWAGFVFKCRLTSLNIEYTLFKPSGTPLRAKLDVAFQEYLSPDEIAKRSKKSSPDLTHLRIVKAGDTLPVMCFRIYGDSNYYPDVARHNGLRDFRNLPVGARLLFPPLGKA
jgi:hypothetical protein